MSVKEKTFLNIHPHNFPEFFPRWFLPFIGHMGIATSSGVIHDFSGSYYVSEDNMGFGNPTRYLQLDISKVVGGDSAWDRSIMEASKEYRNHVVQVNSSSYLFNWINCGL